MQSKPFIALLAVSALLVACTPVASNPYGSDAASSVGSSLSAMDVTSSTASVAMHESSAAVPSSVAATRVVPITVESFAFTPSMVTVKKGEKVTMHLVGKSGIHGFAVPELGINARVEEGQTVDVTLPTDQTGTFRFFCSVPCGPGHREMQGSIVIE